MLQQLRGYTPLNPPSQPPDSLPKAGYHNSVKRLAAYGVLSCFLLYVLFLGVGDAARDAARRLLDGLQKGESKASAPDFDHYIHLRTLSEDDFKFDDPSSRLIFVGDVHGRDGSLAKLLKKLSYTTTTDTLIHTGDIIAKSPLAGSLATLDLMTKSNITGVRGNHDQMVIGWRGWIERVLSHPKGKKWLEKQEKKGKKKALKYLKGLMQVDDLEHAESDWKRVPDEWEFLGDHYRIARAMTDEQAKYLRSLPLILHIPRLHGFVVHAGLLPLDPNRSATNLRQPLAHVPVMDVSLVEDDEAVQKAKLLKMRTRQEGAVLEDIPQNTDPWVLLNMRSLLNDNSISRDSKEGSPWASLWNSIVARCGGFNDEIELSSDRVARQEDDDDDELDESHNSGNDNTSVDTSTKRTLPCYPSTVIYGHAASRGLDIERWSKGLDSGCVYGRRLTALILSPSSSSDEDDLSDSRINFEPSEVEADKKDLLISKRMRFGDRDGTTARARVVSVGC